MDTRVRRPTTDDAPPQTAMQQQLRPTRTLPFHQPIVRGGSCAAPRDLLGVGVANPNVQVIAGFAPLGLINTAIALVRVIGVASPAVAVMGWEVSWWRDVGTERLGVRR